MMLSLGHRKSTSEIVKNRENDQLGFFLEQNTNLEMLISQI